MDAATARKRLRERAYDLSPEQFEVLCKVVLGNSLQTQALTVTPSSQDGGIDIEGRLSYEWFAADYGVQVKRYATDNTVGSDRVHRLAGALVDDDYDLGTLVTTSSYTGPAQEVAQRLPVKLVSGTEFSDTMLRHGIGVAQTDTGYAFDEQFWETLTESDEQIPAGDVPLGSNFDRLRAVLLAMRHTRGTKDAIRTWVTANLAPDLSERHVYINANSATVLGLARKEPGGQATLQQWGLTETGAEFVNAPVDSAAEQQVLVEAIRSVDLVERLLEEIQTGGELPSDEIDDRIAAETTGLSDSSVRRRGSSVRTWLGQLPEIDVERSDSTKLYRDDAAGTDDSLSDWL